MFLKYISLFSILAMVISCGQNPAASTSTEQSAPPVFDSVVFHTSMCFGACPVYHLQVNGDGQTKFHAEVVYQKDSLFKKDSTRIGYYEGKLSDSLFNQLQTTLTATPADSLVYNPQDNCCDGVLKTIIVYQKGKRKFLRYMFNPGKAEELSKVLYRICEENQLPKTDKKLEFENPVENEAKVPVEEKAKP